MVEIILFISIIAYLANVCAFKLKTNEKYNDIGDYSPPISIIKPIKGLDDDLYKNIRSFCLQDYSNFEIILSLESIHDPAYRICEKIKNEFPNIVNIVISKNRKNILNKKVKNMIDAYNKSRYDIFLISDSNIYVEKDYLKNIVKHLKDPNVGLVSNIVIGKGEKSLGALLDNLTLNTNILYGCCILDKLIKIPCVLGKSILMKKKDFENFGGFEKIKNVLAEDYMLGKLTTDNGKKIVMSNYLIYNINKYSDIKYFFNRQLRWSKMRFKIGGWKYLFEILQNPTFISIIFTLLNLITIKEFFVIVISKILLDYLTNQHIKLKYVPILIIKDILYGIIFINSLLFNKITQRGTNYKITKDTQIILS